MLLERFLACHAPRQLDGRHNGNHMVAKVRKPQRDEPYHDGAGRVDNRVGHGLALEILARIFGDDLRGAGHFEHLLETDVQ
ncbi:hypothetical protein SDC9_194981 [bioreactor metagenome]|uniref:Uncharacterized protein n=1 Tax=bioreactor metagenome TaxID=1076179 RepID=A0A645IAB0_9ZZZZ